MSAFGMSRYNTLIAVQESLKIFPVRLSSGGSTPGAESGVIGLFPAGMLRIGFGSFSGRRVSLSDMVMEEEVVITKWRWRMEKSTRRRIQANGGTEIATGPRPELGLSVTRCCTQSDATLQHTQRQHSRP